MTIALILLLIAASNLIQIGIIRKAKRGLEDLEKRLAAVEREWPDYNPPYEGEPDDEAFSEKFKEAMTNGGVNEESQC